MSAHHRAPTCGGGSAHAHTREGWSVESLSPRAWRARARMQLATSISRRSAEALGSNGCGAVSDAENVHSPSLTGFRPVEGVPIGSTGKARRHSRQKRSKQVLSGRGRERPMLCPGVGSTAAYGHSHSSRSSQSPGGRAPLGHQRRWYQPCRPTRASSMTHTLRGSYADYAISQAISKS
jgi:hypothetical protein